jgi:multidrug efflux pump subunit AcrB
MSHGRTDQDIVAHTHNTARFFTEWRHISWVLLVGTVAWGIFGYRHMPQRKDPDIPIRQALALVPWPGASTEKIEQLVTRRVEEKVAENARVDKIESNTRTGLTAIFITLVDGSFDVPKEFDDIKMKLDSIGNLPDGAGPIQFVKDFGDTAALMLTVASPKTSALEIGLRAQALRAAMTDARAQATPGNTSPRVTIAHGLPTSIEPGAVRPPVDLFVEAATADGVLRDARVIEGSGFVAIDAATDADDAALEAYVQRFLRDRLRASEMHPDAWTAIVVRDPADAEAKLAAVAGDKYTYRELDDYTDLITRTLKTLPVVSKITRSGLLDERVFLEYSQERLASYGVSPGTLRDVLAGRNITATGGILEVGGKNLTIDPSGEFKSEQDIGQVLVPTSNGRAVYLRDLVDVGRGYATPPSYLNFFGARGADGEWRRSRAVTLAIQMRAGQKIDEFAKAVDGRLAELKSRLPEDLELARTSDQPRQVAENVSLFMNSLYEAVALVVLVSLIGFWEWRSALLMALSIPITLAMTFGMMYALGIDLQSVSIGSLIIALGLLVDDPVVAGDAIKRDLAAGHPPVVAAWLGPTKLATAILFATITNIVAYLPFLMLPGDTGTMLYSLPVVVGSALVASRLVSMTFIPLLGYYLLKPKAEPTIEERRKSGFAAAYYRVGRLAIAHRWAFLAGAMAFLVAGGGLASQLKSQYFPKDLQYLSYVDVWLPEDAPLSSTQQATLEAEAIVREVAGERLRSLTTFVGGGGPRFWVSAGPEQSQLNYAQILMEVYDKHDSIHLAEALQHALSERIAGARIDVRLLEVGAAVGIPVQIRVAGEDIATLRGLSTSVADILRGVPTAVRVRDNWGPESFAVHLKTDADRANLVGLTNREIAGASSTAMNGTALSTLREGDKQIPIVARMRVEERAALSDIRSLYVYSAKGQQKVPLESVTTVEYGMQTEKLQRRNQFRTITISAFAADGVLPSEVLNAAMPGLKALERSLPPGYTMEIGGEYGEQVKGFGNLAMVMLVSIAMIFLALVIQFRHAVKPLIVFAAIPFGIMGALIALRVMNAPFGFMAFLGVASLIGVIVSHIIVLFDFIEEKRVEGESLEDALLDAGIMRLRPVLITVAATVIALFPLAAHGGPLWEPMCYTQIGGLSVATFVTLLVVPVIYAIFVKDLKIVKWDKA